MVRSTSGKSKTAGKPAQVLASHDDDQALIGPAVMALANLIRRSGNVEYEARLGLSSMAWRIIAWLGREGPMTQTELAESAQFDKGQLSRSVAEIAAQGLIVRHRRTWRSIELSLSEEGAKTFAAIRRISRTRNLAFTRGLDQGDIEQFFTTLAIITANAKDLVLQQHSNAPPRR